MALLHAMHDWARSRIAAVATFDHATGPHARSATALVCRTAGELGLPVVTERARHAGRSEAEWRAARWTFLNRHANALGARVATAHTRDDQLETVVQRVLRGAGARGLAALAADGPVVRPWLAVTRADVARWAEAHGVRWLDDPSNTDRRHQRVRVRHDLLPAIARVDPGFTGHMLALGERAATWRRDVELLVDAVLQDAPLTECGPGIWQFPYAGIARWPATSLAVLWPALLARCGITLTGEGTERLVRFTIGASRAGELQLPGGVAVVRRRAILEIRSGTAVRRELAARVASRREVSVGSSIRWPGWRIEPVAWDGLGEGRSPDLAAFPASGAVVVRGWQPGDRLVTQPEGAGRRISRYLAEAGVPRLDRVGWPVVLLDGEVVWVPGICRGLAAPHRSGRSDFIWYRSEREFG